MKFVVEKEIKTLIASMLGPDGRPVIPGPGQRAKRVSFEGVADHSYFGRAQAALNDVGYFDWCVLWVVLTGVWRSNENLHLYYRLRQSYGDFAHVEDVQGIVGLRHELVDIATFLHLGMLFGWEMYLVTNYDEGRLFVSHDGWYEVSVAGDHEADKARGGEDVRPAT